MRRAAPPSARSADRKAITRANCRRLAYATQPESVPYVFLIGAAWQANRRTHASHRSRRRDPGHDRIGLDWVGREEGCRPQLGGQRDQGHIVFADVVVVVEINFPKGGSNAWLGVQGAPHLVPSGPGVPSCMKIINLNQLRCVLLGTMMLIWCDGLTEE